MISYLYFEFVVCSNCLSIPIISNMTNSSLARNWYQRVDDGVMDLTVWLLCLGTFEEEGEGYWSFVLEVSLTAQRLVCCCGNLENNTKQTKENKSV